MKVNVRNETVDTTAVELEWDTGSDENGLPAVGVFADGEMVMEISMIDVFQAFGKENIMKLVKGIEALPLAVPNWPKKNDTTLAGTLQ